MIDVINNKLDETSNLIWGYSFQNDSIVKIKSNKELENIIENNSFKWLHFNLADQWTLRFLENLKLIPKEAFELLLSNDKHPRAHVNGNVISGIIQDFERDLDSSFGHTGILRYILTENIMITARAHSLVSGDIIHDKIKSGVKINNSATAFEILINSIGDISSKLLDKLNNSVQSCEDVLIENGTLPDPRELLKDRRQSVQLHRHLSSLKSSMLRLELVYELPENLKPVIARLNQKISSLDSDVMVLQSNLRQLREELDVQTANRINQNLYLISVLSALLLPATLITGFFGMNTGGMLWAHSPIGTFFAFLTIILTALLVLFWLHKQSFFKP